MNEYNVDVGDTVCHIKDDCLIGIVVSIDRNLEDVTTCRVLWEGVDSTDIQWTNKLVRIEK